MKKNKKIYMVHGWTYSTVRWTPFIDELKKRGIEADILRIPGLTAPLKAVWTIDDYIEWLNEILKKEKGEVILLGHSNGGLVSMSYVIKYPEIVDKLILMGSTGIYHKELSIRIKRFAFMTIAKIGKKFTKSPILRRLIYKIAKSHDYEQANPIVQKTMLNLLKVDLQEKFSEIKIPTTIIWGKGDQVTPVKDGVKMNKEIKNSSLHIVNGARHSPQLTNPLEVAEIIAKNL